MVNSDIRNSVVSRNNRLGLVKSQLKYSQSSSTENL